MAAPSLTWPGWPAWLKLPEPQFLWPHFLWLLLTLPLLVLLYVWLMRRKRKTALGYSGLAIIREAMGPGQSLRRHIPPALFLAALAAMFIAAARPTAVISLPSMQETIMLAMDVSGSMRATDVLPNRLVASQNAAKAFLAELPRHVRVGIVAFAGTAAVVQPPTLSREDLVAAIDKFQLQRGTAIGNGIVVSLSELFPDAGIDLASMQPSRERMRGTSIEQSAKNSQQGKEKAPFVPVAPGSYASAAIILLTDGQRTSGVDSLEAAKLAADRGVRIYVVGLGSVGDSGAMPEGMPIYLQLDEPTLREVARMTGGEYHHAGTAEALRSVYQQLGSRMQVSKDRKSVV